MSNKQTNWDVRTAPLETATPEEKEAMNMLALREAERWFERHRDKTAYVALMCSHLQRMLNSHVASQRGSEAAWEKSKPKQEAPATKADTTPNSNSPLFRESD